MSGSLASQSSRFNLPLFKGKWPHLFCQEKNFNYIGDIPADKFYLNFGEKNVDAETLQYLTEKRNSNQPWSFNEELIQYCINDVVLLRKACQIYILESFTFQKNLIRKFGSQTKGNVLPLIDPFSPPYFTLASYSFSLLRTYGLGQYKDRLFTIMNPSGIHSIKSSVEEYQYLSFLENHFKDLEHGYNCNKPLKRYCNAIPVLFFSFFHLKYQFF